MAPPPALTLEDVARDAFRRELFAQAFPDEQAALARQFALLALARRYKALAGRRDALLLLAREVVDDHLPPPPPADAQAQDAQAQDAELARVGAHVRSAVAAGRAPLDLLAGVEALVKARLAREHLPRFVASAQYAQLCEALRARRELPLAALLVDARGTARLERFLREAAPAAAANNLRFWVDVQTRFLPLLQAPAAATPARFEQVQRAVRRLYNQFLADGAPLAASRVPAGVRRDALAKIMQLQGEPFSPPRYANLFRAAQDCVWQWLQADVYPRFRASDLYVQLVVEAEDLEADRQLRRLSDHLRAGAGSTGGATAVVIVPIPSAAPTRAPPPPLAPLATDRFARSLAILTDGGDRDALGVRSVAFLDAEAARRGQEPRPWAALAQLFGASDRDAAAAETHPTYLEFCWDPPPAAAPAAHPTSPAAHRPPFPPQPPAPAFRDFVVPDEAAGALYGLCLTRWRLSSSGESGEGESDWRARVVVLMTTRPAWRWGRQLLLCLEALEPSEATDRDIDRAIRATHAPAAERLELSAALAGFRLRPWLVSDDFPVQSAFREISSQTLLVMLSCVLTGKSIVMVAEEPSTLTLVGEALRTAIRPFQWEHLFLPYCPLWIAAAIAERGAFKEHAPPFIVGFSAVLDVQKHKEPGNSIYSIQKATLQLQVPPQPGSSAAAEASLPVTYPAALLQTQAIVVDIDSDDVYIPERTEVPELPQSLVRNFEGLLSESMRSPSTRDADSFLFSPWKRASPFGPMLAPPMNGDAAGAPPPPSGQGGSANENPVNSRLGEFGARLAVLQLLESLLGDVVYHFCSFQPSSSAAAALDAASEEQPDKYLVFEADSFLDARMELGCRDFFRQCFRTELFRRFLVAQHEYFCAVDSVGD